MDHFGLKSSDYAYSILVVRWQKLVIIWKPFAVVQVSEIGSQPPPPSPHLKGKSIETWLREDFYSDLAVVKYCAVVFKSMLWIRIHVFGSVFRIHTGKYPVPIG